MGMLFSPTFWIAMLIWSGICATGGASLMSRWDDDKLQKIQVQLAQDHAANAKAALVLATRTERETAELQAKLEASRAQTRAASAALRGKTGDYITPQADAATVVPSGFVRLWNAAGAGDDKLGSPASPPPEPGAANAPSGVALSTIGLAVQDAADALKACRDQVIGWQDFWKLVEKWYQDFVKGLAK
jgi:hypothetical protein